MEEGKQLTAVGLASGTNTGLSCPGKLLHYFLCMHSPHGNRPTGKWKPDKKPAAFKHGNLSPVFVHVVTLMVQRMSSVFCSSNYLSFKDDSTGKPPCTSCPTAADPPTTPDTPTNGSLHMQSWEWFTPFYNFITLCLWYVVFPRDDSRAATIHRHNDVDYINSSEPKLMCLCFVLL